MGETLRVLMVDDSEDDAALVRRHLTRALGDIDLRRIDTHAEWTAALASAPPHLVLCDQGLPELPALTLVAAWRRAHPNVPVVVFSGRVNGGDVAGLRAAGVADVIGKHDLEALEPIAAAALGRGNAAPRGERHPGRGALVAALRGLAQGRFAVRVAAGEAADDEAEAVNEIAARLQALAGGLRRLTRGLGRRGDVTARLALPVATGGWAVCTAAVDELVADLLRPLAAIADAAEAAARGDLPAAIDLDGGERPLRGESRRVAGLVNHLLGRLAATTRKTTEQDWVHASLARCTRRLQGERDLGRVAAATLRELADLVGVHRGAFYARNGNDVGALALVAEYGAAAGAAAPKAPVRGLVRQCAADGQPIVIDAVPPGYFDVASGLGRAAPRALAVLPMCFEGSVNGVLELASLHSFGARDLLFLGLLAESLGVVLHTVAGRTRTESLLAQSQALTAQLRTTNRDLEEKAGELARASRYKSEFVSNMSHELRTPLNTLMLLSELLTQNREGTLTPTQVESARTIHGAGAELLELIDDILDLSKLEAGLSVIEVGDTTPADVAAYGERTFRHVAESRGLVFTVEVAPDAPATLTTDVKRLRQILRNLLSNAVKFTERGSVRLRIARATSGWSREHVALARARVVVAFAVQDTGVGIPPERRDAIFDPFHQAEQLSRRAGRGTGIGLSISRGLCGALGGELTVESAPGRGSTFTLYLPATLDATPQTDVVLMDIMLPGMDGHAAIRAIRRDPRFTRLPVVAVTAKAMKGDREACFDAGASEYLSKPVSGPDLRRVLGQALAVPTA